MKTLIKINTFDKNNLDIERITATVKRVTLISDNNYVIEVYRENDQHFMVIAFEDGVKFNASDAPYAYMINGKKMTPQTLNEVPKIRDIEFNYDRALFGSSQIEIKTKDNKTYKARLYGANIVTEVAENRIKIIPHDLTLNEVTK